MRIRTRLMGVGIALAVMAPLPAAFATNNYGCTANVGCNSTNGDQAYIENRAMKPDGGAPEYICAYMVYGQTIKSIRNIYNNTSIYHCPGGTTFVRHCYYASPNAHGNVSGSGPWYVDGRAANDNDDQGCS